MTSPDIDAHVGPARVGATIGFLMAGGVGAIAVFNGNSEFDAFWYQSLPLVALIALPAILATIGVRRPPALLAAGVISIPTAFISMAGATLPLLIPAGFYFVAYGRAPRRRSRIPIPLLVIGAVAMSIGGLAFALSGGRTVCYEKTRGPGGSETVRTYEGHSSNGSMMITSGRRSGGNRVVESGCSSGVPSPGRVAMSVAILAGGVFALAWLSSSPVHGPVLST